MKKSLLHFAYVGAIALVGSVCFSACSDDVSKELETNPVNGGQKVDFTDVVGVSDVPVDFMFNVSTKTGADTRMSAEVVQDGNNVTFRGINRAKIAAYKTANNGDWITNPAPSNSRENSVGILKIFPEFTSLISSAASTTRVLELAMPSGTNGILFYGSAPNGGDNEQFGKVVHNDPGDDIRNMITSYQKRVTDKAKFYQVGDVIAAIMTGLVDMGFKGSSPNIEDRDFYFWWPEGNANENYNDKYTYADNHEILNNDYQSIYMLINGNPSREKEDDIASYKTANNAAILPEASYLAKNITTGNYVGYTGDTTLSENDGVGKVGGMIVSKTFDDNIKYTLYHSDVTWKAYSYWNDQEDTSGYPNFNGEYEPNLSPLGQKLAAAYKALTTMKEGELRSASGNDILALAKDLYDVIQKVATAKPTNKKEYVATKFAQRLLERISTYFNFTDNNNAWKSLSTWGANLVNFVFQMSGGNNTISINGLANGDVSSFPSSFKVPSGASLLSFSYYYGPSDNEANNQALNKDKGGLFSFKRNIENYDLGGATDGSSTVTVENYVYPAELMYWGNSSIRVTDKELIADNYPQTSNVWTTDGSWSSNDWAIGDVTSNTHAVAMKANVNYGVAMLETSVRIGATTLKDNNHAINPNEQDREINYNANLFELTGIIIGEQPQSVGWDYTPATVPTTTVDGKDMTEVISTAHDKLKYWDRLVYDNVMSDGTTNGVPVTDAPSPGVASYTLLLDNYMNEEVQTKYKNFVNYGATPPLPMPAKQQQIVYIALEFKNKSAGNFMGKDNMVRNGSKFYLIGKLDPNTKNVNGRTDGHPIPPFEVIQESDHHNAVNYTSDEVSAWNAAHTNDQITTSTVKIPAYDVHPAMDWTPRVFMQDYKTRVTFTIGEDALKHAYLTVPNLKASQVSLGLSVDITWEQGIDFGDVNL